MMPITPRCCWEAYIICACSAVMLVNGCGKEDPYIRHLKNKSSLNEVPKKLSSSESATPGPHVTFGNLQVTFVNSVSITKAPESPSSSFISFGIVDEVTGASYKIHIKKNPIYDYEPRVPTDPRSIVPEMLIEIVDKHSLGGGFWSEYKSPWDLHHQVVMATPARLEQKTGRDREQLLGELILKDSLPSSYGYWDWAGCKAVFTTDKGHPTWTLGYLYDSKGSFLGTILADQDTTSNGKHVPELGVHKLLFSAKRASAGSEFR